MIYVCYILNHIACGALNGSIPLLVLYGFTPYISIMLLYTFYLLIPNRDSHNGYPTVRPAKLQSVTLSHQVDTHKILTTHKLACSCFVALFGHQ